MLFDFQSTCCQNNLRGQCHDSGIEDEIAALEKARLCEDTILHIIFPINADNGSLGDELPNEGAVCFPFVLDSAVEFGILATNFATVFLLARPDFIEALHFVPFVKHAAHAGAVAANLGS
jgi:hypothetical protein